MADDAPRTAPGTAPDTAPDTAPGTRSDTPLGAVPAGDLALSDLPGTTVTVYPDGPLVVRGDFVVDDVDGRVLERGRSVALCRCGRSARKPLCDGSHRNALRRRPSS